MAAKVVARVKLSAAGLVFEGVIDNQTIPGLIQALPKPEVSSPVLDLSAVSRIDSAGLAFLIDWGRQHLAKGQNIKLSGCSEQASQLIETMKLESLFDLQPE